MDDLGLVRSRPIAALRRSGLAALLLIDQANA
jgi:hypothetical protein